MVVLNNKYSGVNMEHHHLMHHRHSLSVQGRCWRNFDAGISPIMARGFVCKCTRKKREERA
ncbi:hypothetical protein NECAME_09719 [Necator americanus]|uniref:Uncharacterized protein n=1 Tax=Necator americanus TaxID=51031 RepID=W2TCQ9_NECAM|nr:hypothetical protein NECAME_09719 [Necator americanus]ETN79633.1 hypothetical protein NECAME_09719 [Necator americanus]